MGWTLAGRRTPATALWCRHKSEVLGTVKQFPTKRLAQRELDARVSVVNSRTYRARPTATFRELAERWKLLVMPLEKPCKKH
jgi:hypothetical protein